MGGNEDNLRKQMRQAGDFEGLAELDRTKPKLRRDATWYMTAFLDLDTERTHGMGLMKIPRSAVIAYADECELSEAERYDLAFIIREVDNDHLERLAAQRDTNT